MKLFQTLLAVLIGSGALAMGCAEEADDLDTPDDPALAPPARTPSVPESTASTCRGDASGPVSAPSRAGGGASPDVSPAVAGARDQSASMGTEIARSGAQSR